MYTDNVIDKKEYFHYISTSAGVFAYGASKGETYLVNWLNGRLKQFSDIELDYVLECGSDKTIYCFPTNANGLYKFDKSTQTIQPVNVFGKITEGTTTYEQLSNVKCAYGFETSDGLFIIGSIVTTDSNNNSINKDVIYFSPNKFTSDSDTESQRKFTRILICDNIDFCQPFDNEILVSTYDSKNPYVKYYFDRDTYTFKNMTITDTNHIYSFNCVETFNGKIYVLNGTGSNPNVRKGFGVITRNLYDASSNIAEDNKFYDIKILKDIDNTIMKMNSPCLFVHGGILFGMFINKKTVDTVTTSTFEIYVYNTALDTFVKVDKTISPLIYAIINVANQEIKDIEESSSDIESSIAIQETANKNEDIIKNYDFSDIIDDYQCDKFYFDKENNGVNIGNYLNGNNYFRLTTNCIAKGCTVSDHKTQIAMILPKENYVAIYDKSYKFLKTISLRYKAYISAAYHYVPIDDRFVIKGVFIGSGSTENTMYILVKGTFPILSQSGSSIVEQQTSTISTKLFKVAISELIGSTVTTGTVYDTDLSVSTDDTVAVTDTKAYIKKQNLFLSEDIDYDVRNTLQFIGTGRNVLYDNVDSLIFWNTNSASLDIYSPIIWNTNIKDINLSGTDTKEAETYKDYKIFVSSPTGKNGAPKFYNLDGEKNIKSEITVDYSNGEKVLVPNTKINGKTWTQSNITSDSFIGIDHNDSVFVVGSSNGLYYSTDGKTWIQSDITSISFYYIDHNDSVWVACSSNGLYYSTDGKTWTQSNITSGYFLGIDHNDSVFVVGSSGKGLYYSTDYKTWTQSNITSKFFNCIDHNDSVFVAASDSGLYYSTDGKTWTQSNITSKYFIGIDHNDSVFVVGSNNSGLYYSTDGKTWTQSNITSKYFNCIDHNDSVFVVGSNNSGLYYSTDGKTWTQSNITSKYFNCIDHNDSVFVVGSSNNEGLYYCNSISGFLEKYTVPMSFCRIGKTIFADGAQLPIITDIVTNTNKSNELTSFNIKKNTNFTLADDLDITMMRPTVDGAIAFVNNHRTVGTGDSISYTTRDDLYYRLNNDGTKASKDKFVLYEKHYYNNALQTRFGLFRWNNSSFTNKTDMKEFFRNVYFNPKGIDKTICIRGNTGSIIKNVFEVVEGIFFAVEDYYQVGNSLVTNYKLYHMVSVPTDDSHVIYLDDTSYFEEVDCNRQLVIDLANTQYGTFLITNSDGLGCVMKWNGTTFYKVTDDDLQVIGMFDTSEDLIFIFNGKNYFYTWVDATNEIVQTTKYGKLDSVSLNNMINSVYNSGNWFGHPRHYYETSYGPIVGISNKFFNFNTKQAIVLSVDQVAVNNYFTIRKYTTDSDYKSRNLYKLANYLYNHFGLPLDVNMKCFGSILYNGLQVMISGIKILSKPGDNTEPFTVIFTIDKDMRFTRNIDTIKALYAKKNNNGYLTDLNVGIITDYNTDTEKYYDHVYNISKVNLVVISDKIADAREEEFKQQYETLLGNIQTLTSQLAKTIELRTKTDAEQEDAFRNLEQRLDAYNGSSDTTNLRNVAVTFGYTVDSNGAALIDGDSIKGFTQLAADMRNALTNHRYNKIYPGDYIIIPKLDYLNESGAAVTKTNVRFDIVGVNTYNNEGILLQSHYVFDDCTTYYGSIKANTALATFLESTYGFKLQTVNRRLGINTYTVPGDLAAVQAIMPSISSDGTNTATNDKWYAQKVFFQAETEIGHPMQSNCNANQHSCSTWTLYNKAPQLRVKYLYGTSTSDPNNRCGYWTDTFAATGTPTNGQAITYGQLIFESATGIGLRSNANPATNTNITTNWTLSSNKIGAVPCFYL